MGKRKHQNPRGPVRPDVGRFLIVTIVNLHDMFSEDVQVLRDRLGPFICANTHTEVPFNQERSKSIIDKIGDKIG